MPSTRRWDEGLLGWLLTAAAAAGSFGLCVLGGWLGHELHRLPDIDAPIDLPTED